MTIFELRKIALDHACDDSRSHMNGQTFQAASEVIVTRAKSYLAFLTGEAAKQEPKPVKRKKVRS